MKRNQIFILLFVVLLAAAPARAQMVTSSRVATAQLDKEASTTKAAVKKGDDSEKDAASDAKAVKKKPKKAKMSAERMTYVLSFVGEHHPELGGMLELLKKNQPVTFGKAMNGIDVSVGKLEALKTRKPERYPMALKRWKLSSRISVASAKLKRKDSKANRKELEMLLTEQADIHVENLKSDREQLQKRMAQLDKQIAAAESGKSDQIKRRIETVGATSRKKKKPPTPKKE